VWIGIAVLLAFVWRRPAALPLTVMAELIAEAASRGLKEAFDRERPHADALVHVPHTPSFPSGHATTSFACAATLARFVSTRVAVALYVLAALVAWSRVYVGVHYPLDVVAGAVLGLAVATALRPLPAILRRLLPARRAG
jgi:undecaprenyl-diphosphatase